MNSDQQLSDLQRRLIENLRRVAPVALDRCEPLYRFLRYASNGERAAVDDAMVYGRLRLARPRDFNDPFDCRPHFRLRRPFRWLGRLRYRWASLRLVRERFPNDPEKENRARDDLDKFSVEQLIAVSEDQIRNTLLNSQLMLCLAGNREAIQMWAHYADRQRGVAIHLSPKMWPIAAAMRVSYGRAYPSVPIPPDWSRVVRDFALRKASDWCHEDEYRVLVQDEDTLRFGIEWYDVNTAILPPGTIAGVTIGAMVDSAAQQRIVGTAQRVTPSIPVYRAVPQRNLFALQFEQVA